jgi:hypothetical protein
MIRGHLIPMIRGHSWMMLTTAPRPSLPAQSYLLLRRIGLQTRREHLGVLEVNSRQAAGLFTERTRRRLVASQRRAAPHLSI